MSLHSGQTSSLPGFDDFCKALTNERPKFRPTASAASRLFRQLLCDMIFTNQLVSTITPLTEADSAMSIQQDTQQEGRNAEPGQSKAAIEEQISANSASEKRNCQASPNATDKIQHIEAWEDNINPASPEAAVARELANTSESQGASASAGVESADEHHRQVLESETKQAAKESRFSSAVAKEPKEAIEPEIFQRSEPDSPKAAAHRTEVASPIKAGPEETLQRPGSSFSTSSNAPGVTAATAEDRSPSTRAEEPQIEVPRDQHSAAPTRARRAKSATKKWLHRLLPLSKGRKKTA